MVQREKYKYVRRKHYMKENNENLGRNSTYRPQK